MNKDSLVYKKVQRSNRLILTLSIIGLIVIGGLTAFSSAPYWIAQLTGPIDISGEDISALGGSTSLYNRAVSGLDMDDTFYYEETIDEDTGRQVRIDAYFGALEVGKDVWILVRHPEEINTREEDYIGTLQPVSGTVTREVYELAQDEMRIEFLPVMLDTTGDEVMWYVGTAILVVTAIASLWGVFTFIQRNNDPTKHPIMKKLSRFGDAEQFVGDVERELSSGADKVGKLSLTRNYLVQEQSVGVNAMPYNKVAWLYKFIRSGRYGTKTYEAHINDVTGYEIVVIAKEDEVNQMLNAIAVRAPWAIAGFSDDIKRTWNKDRQSFISQVEKRRKEHLAQQ